MSFQLVGPKCGDDGVDTYSYPKNIVVGTDECAYIAAVGGWALESRHPESTREGKGVVTGGVSVLGYINDCLSLDYTLLALIQRWPGCASGPLRSAAVLYS